MVHRTLVVPRIVPRPRDRVPLLPRSAYCPLVAAAHIQKRANARYRARYRDPSGQERSRTFDRAIDARKFLDEVKAQLVRGEWIDPEDRNTTLGDYTERWIRVQPWRPSTMARTRSVLDNHILPTFGSRKLGSIRRSEIQAWLAGLELAPSTREGTFRLLASVLKAATQDRLLAVSPAAGVRLARREGAVVSPLTVGQVQGLADQIVPSLSAAVLVAAMTGVRQGELFGITEDRVRWLERALVVDRQLVTEKGGVRFGPTKTARSTRVVPLTPRAVELLAQQIAVYGAGEDGLVFHNKGQPWRRNVAGREMQRAGGQGWHALRHHCASILIARGASVTAVAAMLGHSPAETLATYAAWFPSEDDVLRGLIGGAWEPVDNQASRPTRGLAD